MTSHKKRHWTNGLRERLSSVRIAVGSDLHLLEMAFAERNKLINVLTVLVNSTDYGCPNGVDDERPLMRQAREVLRDVGASE